MTSAPFLVNALVNDEIMFQALVDNGCLCSGVINENIARKLKLRRVPVPPRPLETVEDATSDKPIIRYVAFVSIDLDGYLTKNLPLYVVPRCIHPIILGKKWLEIQDAVIHAREGMLHLRKLGGYVYSVERWKKDLKRIPEPEITTLNTMTEALKTVPICKATIDDINKALRTRPGLTEDEARRRLPNQVRDFAGLFADDTGADTLPPHRGHLDHAINLRGAEGTLSPPWGPLYGMSREELLVLRKTLTDLTSKGWIRPSNSPAAAPVLFAKKPNGGLRFCVDYRGLNAMTVPDRYPIPLFKETLRQLTKARWFTKLDVKSAFHRIRIREGDEWMTAFRCRLGLFEWLVTPFGLINAPATFQRYINEHLREHLDLNATAYMDDVLVYTSDDEDDHWRIVREVLEKLAGAGLYLDIEKCNFMQKEVKYL
ncbi:hypothetical protein K3495_g15651, partial [Podosphaera aphanis]